MWSKNALADQRAAARWTAPMWPFESSDPLQLPPEYALARQSGDAVPVRLYDGRIAQLITKHALVTELLIHPDVSASPHLRGYPAPSIQSLRTKSGQRTLVRLDPPEHTAIRRAILPALSPAVVSSMRAYVEELSHLLVDRVLTQQRPEVVGDLADPLPLLVAAKWLGVPKNDASRLAESAKSWASLSGGKTAPETFQGAIDEYFKNRLERTKGEGWSETTAALLQNLEEYGVSADVHAQTLGHLFTSGLSTTSNTLALVFLALSRFHDQRERLIGVASVDVPKAVEELLRFTCVPRHSALRTATSNIEVGSTVVREGHGVIASVAAANRDPMVFAGPNHLDLARSPNRHLTFGPGTHGCIGSTLARMQVTEVLRALRSHPLSTHPWSSAEVEHHMGTTVTVDRLVLRIG